MPKSRSLTIGFLLIVVMLSPSRLATATKIVLAAEDQARTEVRVTLEAAQNTVSWDERLPDAEPFELPLLYLHRERTPAVTTQAVRA